jgi:hypothetical protein
MHRLSPRDGTLLFITRQENSSANTGTLVCVDADGANRVELLGAAKSASSPPLEDELSRHP